MNVQSTNFRDELVPLRRELHRHAEKGWEEFWTSAFVASKLDALGVTVLLGEDVIAPEAAMGRPSPEELEKARTRALGWGASPSLLEKIGLFTGVVGILKADCPGPVTAFRFDMDAVEVGESRDPEHRPLREGFAAPTRVWPTPAATTAIPPSGSSWRDGSAKTATPRGTFKFLFQPAEEGVRGGKSMTEKGLLDDVDVLLGLHLGVGMPSGAVGAGCGDFLCTTKSDAVFTGGAAHAGGAPNEGRNALLAAASAVLGLHAISPPRDGASRINVGVLQGGTGRNVIPPRAELKLETRGATAEIDGYVRTRAMDILKGAAISQGVALETRLAGGAIDASSHPELVDLVAAKALGIEGIRRVERHGRISGSEDISWMMQRVHERGGRSCYFILGADTTAGHHNERFDFDEEVLGPGVALLKELTLEVAGR
jgi:aminobenzoyl-glutamate utilization protein A